MTPEQLVEVAAKAVQEYGVSIGVDGRTWEQIPEFARQQYRDDARAALDAVMPLVLTTWETED